MSLPRIPVLTGKREHERLSRVQTAVVVLTAVVLGAAGLGHALDCGGRLVSEGASP